MTSRLERGHGLTIDCRVLRLLARCGRRVSARRDLLIFASTCPATDGAIHSMGTTGAASSRAPAQTSWRSTGRNGWSAPVRLPERKGELIPGPR